MKTKKEVNYRKQNDLYENRNKTCENCYNFFAVTPYKNRCMIMDTDISNKKLSIHLNGVCDLFNGFNTHRSSPDCKCQDCTNYFNALAITTPLQF